MTCLVFFGRDFYKSSSSSDKGTQSQPVALKFMKKREHYDSELTSRYGPKREDGTWDMGSPVFKPEFVVSVRDHFVIEQGEDSQSPVFLHFQKKKLKEMREKEEEKLMPRRSSIAASAAEHKFCIVMPQMLRNLCEAIGSLNIAGNPQKVPDVMKIAHDVARCLHHVHKMGFIHADVKPRNIAYDPKLQKWLLIDCDAMVELDKPVGAKHSSAYNPPEFIAKGEKNQCVLRAPGSEGAAAEGPVTAKCSWDIWGFGAVLFELCSKVKLFESDVCDEVTHRDIKYLFKCREDTGKKGILMRKLNSMKGPLDEEDGIGDDNAIHLASTCFGLLPKSHAVSMGNLLKHPFFSKEQRQTSAEVKEMVTDLTEKLDEMHATVKEQTIILKRVDERTKRLDERTFKMLEMQLATRGDIAKYSGRLHRAIQAATDDQYPSAFVLLPPPPPPVKEQRIETRTETMRKVIPSSLFFCVLPQGLTCHCSSTFFLFFCLSLFNM